MVYGAIDLHTRRSEIRMIDGEGRVLRERRIATTADGLVAAFAGVGPVRILLESGTESEWVACTLEERATTWSSRIRITRRCTGIGSAGSRPIAAMWRRGLRPIGTGGFAARIAGRRRRARCSTT